MDKYYGSQCIYEKLQSPYNVNIVFCYPKCNKCWSRFSQRAWSHHRKWQTRKYTLFNICCCVSLTEYTLNLHTKSAFVSHMSRVLVDILWIIYMSWWHHQKVTKRICVRYSILVWLLFWMSRLYVSLWLFLFKVIHQCLYIMHTDFLELGFCGK